MRTRHAIGAGLLLLTLGLSGCGVGPIQGTQGGDPIDPPTSSSPTQTPTEDETTQASGSSGEDLDINVSFTDPGMDVDITVQKVHEPVPGVAKEGFTTPAAMIGIRIYADISRSPYYPTIPMASEFDLTATDGTQVFCVELLTDDSNMPRTQEVLAAIGGDAAYEMSYDTYIAQGWFVCEFREDQIESFSSVPGMELTYTRNAAQTSDGTVIPEFTQLVYTFE